MTKEELIHRYANARATMMQCHGHYKTEIPEGVFNGTGSY